MTGIVTLHPTRIFIGKIKHLRHTAEDNVERLLLKLAGALHTALVGEAFQLIKLISCAPILEPAAGRLSFMSLRMSLPLLGSNAAYACGRSPMR